MFSVNETNEFIKNYKGKRSVFRPKFHFAPKVGWINDPYGLVKFNDVYHLFYQYHPFDNINGDMAWGHLTTRDFIHFKEEKVAITPTEYYDNKGCWSGSVLVKDNKMYLFYTGFSLHEDNKYYQTINLAISEDGINFVKSDLNPIIGVDRIPTCANIYDFRDPCVFIKNDMIYLLIGTKNDHEAMTLLYSSKDLKEFKFERIFLRDFRYGTMFECPNLLTLNNHNYLIMSPQNIMPNDDNFFNVSSSVYVKLADDLFLTNEHITNIKEIDHGFEYYAPTIDNKNKICVSWLQMWGRRYYLHEINDDFINCLSLFKDIVEDEEGHLRFIPLKEYNRVFSLSNKFSGKLKENEEISFKFGLHYRAKIKIDLVNHNIFTINLTKNKLESVKLIVSKLENKIYIDRTNLKVQLSGVDHTMSTLGLRYLNIDLSKDSIDFDIFIDGCSIEIFIDNYKESMSLLSFSKGKELSIKTFLPLNYEILESEFNK